MTPHPADSPDPAGPAAAARTTETAGAVGGDGGTGAVGGTEVAGAAEATGAAEAAGEVGAVGADDVVERPGRPHPARTSDVFISGGSPDTRAQIHAAGLAVRREVLGDAHVDRAQARTDDFTAEFQDLITRYAWGTIWTRPGLDRVTRSAITLTALVAGGHDDELAMHVRAAMRNGMTRDELKEVLLQSAIYCSVPAANTAFRVAQATLAQLDAEAAAAADRARSAGGTAGSETADATRAVAPEPPRTDPTVSPAADSPHDATDPEGRRR